MGDIAGYLFLTAAVAIWIVRPRVDATCIFLLYMIAGVGLSYLLVRHFKWNSVAGVADLTTEDASWVFAVTCAAILFTIISSGISSRHLRLNYKPFEPDGALSQKYAAASILLSITYLAAMMSIYGGLEIFLNTMFRRTRLLNSLANYMVVLSWGSMAFSVLSFYFLQRIKFTRSTIVAFFSITLSVFIAFSSGGRNVFITLLFSLALGQLIKLKSLKLILAGLFAAVATVAVSSALVSLRFEAQGSTSGTTNYEEMDFSKGIIGVNHINALVLAHEYVEYAGHDFGMLYFNTALSPVPRDLWPAKPLPISVALREYKMNDTLGGFPPGLFGEGYISFGYLGFFAVSVLFGITLGRIDATITAIKRRYCAYRMACVALLVPFAGFFLVRGGLDIGFMRLSIIAFWLWIGWLMARHHLNSRSRKDGGFGSPNNYSRISR
jgi:oligosaccharide repeat unit polymerase